jgi:hypothetical protein
MLTVLGGLAEFERELIRSRTSEGRERAVVGRKPKLTNHQRQEAIARRRPASLWLRSAAVTTSAIAPSVAYRVAGLACSIAARYFFRPQIAHALLPIGLRRTMPSVG